MGCKGPICDWTRPMGLLDPCGPAFVEHQADMIAAAMPLPEPAPPAHREDLTVFAALIARLGGETTVSWAEAKRLQGVTVTRWDEPEHMRYRFTLGAPEFETPADLHIGVGPGRISLKMPDGTYKSVDEIRAEAAAQQPLKVEDYIQHLPADDEEAERRAAAMNDAAAPAHECETWMIRRGDTGGRYCASCGKDQ